MKQLTVVMILVVSVLVSTACNVDTGRDGKDNTGVSSGNLDSRDPKEVMDEILVAVKEAYGDNYVPSMPYDEVSMEEYFGIQADLYDVYVAEGPLMSANIDTFVAVHATDGNAKAVEDALLAFRDVQINDAFQYPMNMFKIQASKVIAVGDYVFFITLGSIDDVEFTEESQYIEAFEAQNQLAVDTINAILSK